MDVSIALRVQDVVAVSRLTGVAGFPDLDGHRFGAVLSQGNPILVTDI